MRPSIIIAGVLVFGFAGFAFSDYARFMQARKSVLVKIEEDAYSTKMSGEQFKNPYKKSDIYDRMLYADEASAWERGWSK
jgi:hypothetical protein